MKHECSMSTVASVPLKNWTQSLVADQPETISTENLTLFLKYLIDIGFYVALPLDKSHLTSSLFTGYMHSWFDFGLPCTAANGSTRSCPISEWEIDTQYINA